MEGADFKRMLGDMTLGCLNLEMRKKLNKYKSSEGFEL